MEKAVIKFHHCDKDIYCFFVPENCPVCSESLSCRRFEEAPVSIPSPFAGGQRVKCSFLVRPTKGEFLRQEQSYRLRVEDISCDFSERAKSMMEDQIFTLESPTLKLGVCMKICVFLAGVVYNYNETGICRDELGWDQSVSVPLVQPDMYSLINQWDCYLEQFSSAEMWHSQRYNETEHNCYTYALTFINCVLATQGKSSLTKTEFTEKFVLPRTKRASRYITLYQEISENYFYIVDGSQKEGDDTSYV